MSESVWYNAIRDEIYIVEGNFVYPPTYEFTYEGQKLTVPNQLLLIGFRKTKQWGVAVKLGFLIRLGML